MTVSEWITAATAFLIAVGMAMISVRSFNNKGFLLNNAYIYASKQEREAMDKRPYYRQTAIVFLLLCLIFTVIGVSVVLDNCRIYLREIPLVLAVIIYSIFSSVQINKSEKNK